MLQYLKVTLTYPFCFITYQITEKNQNTNPGSRPWRTLFVTRKEREIKLWGGALLHGGSWDHRAKNKIKLLDYVNKKPHSLGLIKLFTEVCWNDVVLVLTWNFRVHFKDWPHLHARICFTANPFAVQSAKLWCLYVLVTWGRFIWNKRILFSPTPITGCMQAHCSQTRKLSLSVQKVKVSGTLTTADKVLSPQGADH